MSNIGTELRPLIDDPIRALTSREWAHVFQREWEAKIA
jgi:hypothetical protein